MLLRSFTTHEPPTLRPNDATSVVHMHACRAVHAVYTGQALIPLQTTPDQGTSGLILKDCTLCLDTVLVKCPSPDAQRITPMMHARACVGAGVGRVHVLILVHL
jgi:hypothetical protein